MNLREKAEEIFDWGVDQRTDKLFHLWIRHSRGAARIAETIAKKCGMDSDKAYVCGLLHDIGRYKGTHTGLNHITDGYDVLMEKGMPEIARICLTHTFNPKDKVDDIELDDPKKTKFLKDFIYSTEYDDYDKLIQLADYMSGAHGVTTIERRFCSVLWRHGLKDPQADLIALYKLKEYFSKKAGMDIYELFPEEIMKSSLNGTPGVYDGEEEKNEGKKSGEIKKSENGGNEKNAKKEVEK